MIPLLFAEADDDACRDSPFVLCFTEEPGSHIFNLDSSNRNSIVDSYIKPAAHSQSEARIGKCERLPELCGFSLDARCAEESADEGRHPAIPADGELRTEQVGLRPDFLSAVRSVDVGELPAEICDDSEPFVHVSGDGGIEAVCAVSGVRVAAEQFGFGRVSLRRRV